MTNLDVIRDHYAAGSRGDLEGMLAPFAAEIAWTEMAGFPYAGTYHGVEEIVENVFARLGTEWEGFRVDIDELLDAGTPSSPSAPTAGSTARPASR
jgi:uncharacterized protein